VRRFGSGILALVLALTLVGGAAPAAAQTGTSLASGVVFQGYNFGEGLGLENATLLMVPVAFEQPVGSRLTLDLYTAYARGAVQTDSTSFDLSGMVDTRVRASWTATPWAVVTLGLNLPTGATEHSPEEAAVAATLSSELLGFREATWGLGFGATTGLATAFRAGQWGVGLAGSYRMADEFEPRSDLDATYAPGDEVRVRLALDRNLGANKLTAGVTFQNFSQDQLDGRNLFQAGNRWRGDLTDSFRTSRTAVWTAYLTDVWRERGDIFISLVDDQGQFVRDSVSQTGSQNLLVAGVAGSMRLGAMTVRPALDARVQSTEGAGGGGWLVGGGADVPHRVGSFELVPAARLLLGKVDAAGGEDSPGLWGGELGLTLRWGAN